MKLFLERTLAMAIYYLAGIILFGILVYVVANMVAVSRKRMELNI